MFEAENKTFYAWADKIKSIGLATPLAFFLEAYKPRLFITGQFIIIGQPILSMFFSPRLMHNVVTLLSERTEFESFVSLLEQE